jgi:DNA-binding NarL/FixJ family response regulator
MGIARISKRRVRVLVADREGIFRIGLKKLFGVEDDLRVVAEAAGADDVLARAETFQPNLAFIQEAVLAESGGNLISSVLKVAPQCKVVVTASSLTEESSMCHVRNGAAGVILKSVVPQLFVECARRVTAGEKWIPIRKVPNQAKLPEASSAQPPRPVDTLTRREKTIISYLMQGWHNKEISKHLSVREQTVKNYLHAIYDKVGVYDRLELVLYAIHQRLELPPVEATVPLP